MSDWSKAELPPGHAILSGMVVEYSEKYGGFPVTLRAATADEFALMHFRAQAKRYGADRIRSALSYLEEHPEPPTSKP